MNFKLKVAIVALLMAAVAASPQSHETAGRYSDKTEISRCQRAIGRGYSSGDRSRPTA